MPKEDRASDEAVTEGARPANRARRRSDEMQASARLSLRKRLSLSTDSWVLKIACPLLGGLAIAILTAVIMRYV